MDGGQSAFRIRGYRPNFVAHISRAAAALGADVSWLVNDYVALIEWRNKALGLRFASADIVASGDGLTVLEVNSGVCLERFSNSGPDHFRQAAQVYYRALRACAPACEVSEAASVLVDEVPA